MKRILALCCVGYIMLMLSNASADDVRVRYKMGDGLFIGDGENLLHLQGRLQTRYTYNALEGTPDNHTFAIQRVKIKLDGHLFNQKLLYLFQMGFATRARASTETICANAGCTTTTSALTSETTTGLAVLDDFAIDWIPASFFGIKAGQFKVPFLMQQIASSGKQQFVERSLSNAFFDLVRDIGITVHGEILKKRLVYNVFVMNGDGINTINRNQNMMIGTRFDIPMLGTYAPSESDIDHSTTPNFGVGFAYALNKAVAATEHGTIASGTRASHGTIDTSFKYKGFSLQGAGMLSRTHNNGPAITNLGYTGQIGYFLLPKKIEIAARTAGAIFDTTTNQYEYSVAFNYFFVGHSIKWQTDYALLLNERGQDLNDHRIRTQAQFIF